MDDSFPGLSGDLSGLPKSGKVVVGLSGGADSCALAHWISSRIERDRLILAHLNHGLRGDEADRDESFCRDFAKRLGVPIVVRHADVRSSAKTAGESLEQSGRKLRYAFFYEMADSENDRILTAHTADDNAETVILNLVRGTGADGVCGIPRERGKVLRPFLSVTRAETEEYCKHNGISYITDSSNLSLDYSRNRVRLEILPAMRKINPGVVSAINRFTELEAAQRDVLRNAAEGLLRSAETAGGLNCETLLGADRYISSLALKIWLNSLFPGKIEKRHVDLALCLLTSHGAMNLPGGAKLRNWHGVLSVIFPKDSPDFSVPLSLGENILPNGKILSLRKVLGPFKKHKEKIYNLLFSKPVECAIISGSAVVRNRRPKDRFAPPGRGLTKPLKQIFEEARILPDYRGSCVILEIDREIAFLEGVGVSERFIVPDLAETAYLVEIREE